MTDASGGSHVAVVTGGARGIGRAIASRLARRGAFVHLWDRSASVFDTAAEFRSQGMHVSARIVDVTREEDVRGGAEEVAGRWGRVSCLVNNAGINGPTKPTSEYTIDEWRTVLEVNLMGVFLCCKAVTPLLKANHGGRIVNIASVAGKEGNANISAYSAAKAGVIAFTKSLAKELVADAILVNAVAPTMIETDLLKGMTADYIRNVRASIPMGRLGEADEVAAMVTWLCSPECSFSTGAVFDLSGGRATY